MSKFSAWPKGLRILTVIGASVLVVALFVAVGIFGYGAIVTPQVQRATAISCAKHFSHTEARNDCVRGNIPEAKAAQKKLDLAASCADEYSSSVAVFDCEEGRDAQANKAQSAADAADAAAKKAASVGQTLDNPYPVGTKASMQSTNRLDSSTTTFTEWISDFNADWTGYNEFEAPDAGMKYVSFTVNVQATTAGVDAGNVAYDASFTDSTGNVYSHATAQFGASNQMPDVTLGAGQQAGGIVVFEVPTSVTGGIATFGSGTVFESLQ